MIIGIDLDGTICTQKAHGSYEQAVLKDGLLEKLRIAIKQGHTVIIYTARHYLEDILLGQKQLVQWGVPYTFLWPVKPACDIYIDDKNAGVEALDKLVGPVP